MKIDAFLRYEKLSPFEIKDKLIALASETARKASAVMLNAGRGNPNWVATTPRDGFFLLGQFAMDESRRTLDLPDLGGMPRKEGIAGRFDGWLEARRDARGADFLGRAVELAVERFGFARDAFVHELVDSITGDNYPVPGRILAHAEPILQDYLAWALCGDEPPRGKFDLFAVEGGTAAMCYLFRSLMQNRLLHKGDRIALGTPIFTPYLEIPHLAEYALDVVEVAAKQENAFQFSDAEIAKLEDPRVKVFFVVNPSNPASFAIDPAVRGKIVKLVRERRPDLLILTDDVYGTFVPGFRSLMADLPANTIGVYSFSKYFGCTGWRLGVVALHRDNVIDRELLPRLPEADRAALAERYGTIALEPGRIKFIDRVVADSRDVALNHTAGLSLPQQVQMMLFSLFQLLDREGRYRAACTKIVHDRVQATLDGLRLNPPPRPEFAAYYGVVDLEFWFRRFLGDDIVEFMKKTYHPLDIVYRLARDHSIVLLNGGGFAAPDWSVRISFANLGDDVYKAIGDAVRAVARTYVDEWCRATGEPPPAPLPPRRRPAPGPGEKAT
jgi:aspartate 4-decarboxylase